MSRSYGCVTDSAVSEKTRCCFLAVYDRAVDIIAACRLGLNAICMALLVVAEAEDVTAHAERLETAVGVLQLVFLLLGQNLGLLLVERSDSLTCSLINSKGFVREDFVGACSSFRS